MTEDLARELEQIPVGGIPNDFATLKALIQTLPSPLSPEIRSATTAVAPADPTSSQNLLSSSPPPGQSPLVGQQAGSESGAVLGVTSELFYGTSNALVNPALEGAYVAGVVLTTAAAEVVNGFTGKYTRFSGTEPGSQLKIGSEYSRTQKNDNPFNSAEMNVYLPSNLGAADYAVYIEQGYTCWALDNELPFLVAAVKLTASSYTFNANCTKARARMEVVSASNGTRTGEWFDLKALGGKGTVVRISAAFPRLPGGWWADSYWWRLTIEYATSGSNSGSDAIYWGEPLLGFSASQQPIPYSPMIAGWVPDRLQYYREGSAYPNPLFEALDGELRWGSGASAGQTPDLRLLRTGASRLGLNGRFAGSAVEMSLEPGSGYPASYLVNGSRVVTNRQAGWTPPTGTAQRATFATDTVTLINLARAVKALIDDLTAHGLIGGVDVILPVLEQTSQLYAPTVVRL